MDGGESKGGRENDEMAFLTESQGGKAKDLEMLVFSNGLSNSSRSLVLDVVMRVNSAEDSDDRQR